MSKVNIFLTVDTELSVGGAFSNPKLKPVGNEKRIFGEIGKTSYGIPMIMDIAEHYGLKITFFVETLNHIYFGKDETKKVCDYILHRGHDIQLHLHPCYLNFQLDRPSDLHYSDLIGQYPTEFQKELIEQGKEMLTSYGVDRLNAFRAGSYGADVNTLKVLFELGFLIDSSYNLAFCDQTCLLPRTEKNDLHISQGVYEFPITNFSEQSYLRPIRSVPMDINGSDYHEMKFILESSSENSPRNITIMLHSFSFIKNYDAQYRRVKPRTVVIRRFKKLCRFLATHPDFFNVAVFGGLSEDVLVKTIHESVHNFSVPPPLLSIKRGVEQIRDKFI